MAHRGIPWEDVMCQKAGNTDVQKAPAVAQDFGLTGHELRKEGLAEQNDKRMP